MTFFGALCLDLKAAEMNDFFSKVVDDSKSRLLMFNSDEYYEDSTRQMYFLAIDLIGDSIRERDLDKTNLYQLLNKSNKKKENSTFWL